MSKPYLFHVHYMYGNESKTAKEIAASIQAEKMETFSINKVDKVIFIDINTT